ncbi:uncharacterized protein LOC141509824 isoform X3 [Macrotis lagotis]|uniref:uncharacterized protein LOC141509824 isoform X3 n=1 Tax=Macrotis lagotis TaxID=92651 RepID=UPI003D69F9BC
MHGPGLCQKMKSTVLKLVKVASHVHSILHLLSEIQATWPSGLPTRLGQGLAALLSHIDLKHQSLPISSSRQEHFLQSTFSEQNPGARRGEVWPCEGKGLRWCHSGDKAWGTPAQGTRENGGAMLLRSSHLPEVRSSSGSKCILPEILASEILGMGRRWQKVAIGHEREWKRWIEEQRVIGIPVTTTDGSA